MDNNKIKKIRKEITEKYEGIHNQEVATGLFLKKVGYKYVTLLSIVDGTSLHKIDLIDFYNGNFYL